MSILSLVGMGRDAAGQQITANAIPTSVVKAIVKYFGKEGAEQATEFLAKNVSKEVMERVATTAAREGGEEAVEQVARLTAKHGPEVLMALDNSTAVLPVMKALEELPASQVRVALGKLAAGESGKALSTAVTRYGVKTLETELKHPGAGLVLLKHFGDDGAELASKMTSDQAIVIARHADEIAALPAAQRTGVLSLIRKDTEKVVAFAGRFIEANPGKSLFTVATTTIILAEPERILGGDEVVFDADGNPIVVSKAGIVGRSIESTGKAAEHISNNFLQPLFYAALAFAGTFAALWIMLKLWHTHKREKQLTEQAMLKNLPSEDQAS
ncbi:hypothetical protein [Novipirellula caenicola]|uniref:hypothetical protein n=1 Tax=Novipirellula caenicola TaxID=1536901 RepID=UPI0031E8B527